MRWRKKNNNDSQIGRLWPFYNSCHHRRQNWLLCLPGHTIKQTKRVVVFFYSQCCQLGFYKQTRNECLSLRRILHRINRRDRFDKFKYRSSGDARQQKAVSLLFQLVLINKWATKEKNSNNSPNQFTFKIDWQKKCYDH